MALSLAVVCEAPADQRTGCRLADRVACTEIAWVDDDMLPHLRQWRGFHEHDPHLLWKEVGHLAKSHNIKAHGFFDGKPSAPDANATRRALLLLIASERRPDAVVLLRDDDRDTRRREGLEQARKSVKIGIPIVIGLAHTKRECWVIAGFEPQNDIESNRLEEVRRELA